MKKAALLGISYSHLKTPSSQISVPKTSTNARVAARGPPLCRGCIDLSSLLCMVSRRWQTCNPDSPDPCDCNPRTDWTLQRTHPAGFPALEDSSASGSSIDNSKMA